MSISPRLERKRPSRRQALSRVAGLMTFSAAWPAPSAAPMRLVVSEKLVTGVSVNDARAAMLIWIRRVSADTGLAIDFPPQLFESTEGIAARLAQSSVDAVAITAPEYRRMADYLDLSQVVIQGDSENRQYVIVINRTKGMRTLASLKGGKLLVFQGPSTCLSQPWLESLLARERLGVSERFFSSIAQPVKASQAILPVFFGNADACLTTARSVHTMAELNPQISKQLEVIATSPAVCPSFYIFRKNYRSPERDKLIAALTRVLSNPAGRQIMTMFQFDGLTVRSGDVLRETLAILDAAAKAKSEGKI